jgi:hypothetical protein
MIWTSLIKVEQLKEEEPVILLEYLLPGKLLHRRNRMWEIICYGNINFSLTNG